MAVAVGKVQAALTAATQETTLALANLNFDFSLVKVEAPVEYRGLGAALSIKRRNASESGDHHRTARKLGSLFEQMLPDTPSLFKAYGNRVSEIAKSISDTSQTGASCGPFADYVGIDGTNIWAAATSGKAAIAVHLLACMLARIWKAPEAIGVWEQIIAARKQELSTFDETESILIQSLVTSQLSLSRDQLSEWDASARAWLRTADEVKAFTQKQLMLIVENVNIPVNGEMDVYFSVMNAWKTAMTTMDKLIRGMGHSVREGSVLLGLAAWHLYPDMIVLGSSSTEVKQNDSLVSPGGVITIGLQGIHAESTKGVYWSLPLAYVRYYGDPIRSMGSIKPDSSRVTMDQFLQVMLGALCTSWSLNGSQVREAAKLIRTAWRCFLKGLGSLPPSPHKSAITRTHWLKIMADTADHFLKAQGTEQESCRRLIALGQKRCELFGRPTPYATSIMGLRGDSYVKLLENPEAKVQFLRSVVAGCLIEPDTLIIRIQVTTVDNIETYEYLTALPTPRSSPSSGSQDDWIFKRWVVAASTSKVKSDWLHQKREQLVEILGDDAADNIETPGDASWFRWHNPPAFFQDPPKVPDVMTSDEEPEGTLWGVLNRWNPFSSTASTPGTVLVPVITFQPCFGDLQTAAIFRRADRPELFRDAAVTVEELSAAFHDERINAEAFVNHIAQIQQMCKYKPSVSDADLNPELALLNCLKSLETAVMVYRQFPSASISLHVITHNTLALTQWVSLSEPAPPLMDEDDSSGTYQILQPLLNKTLSRPATFSCIAFFESGGFDIAPMYLGNVMAMSSGNSIFVAAPLLCDPAIEPPPHGVQRIIGNVGRPGIAFLFPPESPKTKEWDFGFYQVIRHEAFDGRLDDCFQSTTLHLAFSGYEMPIDVGNHGGRFIEAFFLEAVVSVHDRGEWIADLDVLATFESPLFHSLVDQPSCKEQVRALAVPPSPPFEIVTIDSWKELIDRPTQVAVLRAHGNWLARLASAALSIRLGIPTVVFGESCCWSCGEKTLRQIQSNTAKGKGQGGHLSNCVVFIS